MNRVDCLKVHYIDSDGDIELEVDGNSIYLNLEEANDLIREIEQAFTQERPYGL